MMRPIIGVMLIIGLASVASTPVKSLWPSGRTPRSNHVAWVLDAIDRMDTIKPGVTRDSLLTVFTTEGGLASRLQRTYVSRDCPYFKVDVQFRAAGRPVKEPVGGVARGESPVDRVAKISTPYLQRANVD